MPETMVIQGMQYVKNPDGSWVLADRPGLSQGSGAMLDPYANPRPGLAQEWTKDQVPQGVPTVNPLTQATGATTAAPAVNPVTQATGAQGDIAPPVAPSASTAPTAGTSTYDVGGAASPSTATIPTPGSTDASMGYGGVQGMSGTTMAGMGADAAIKMAGSQGKPSMGKSVGTGAASGAVQGAMIGGPWGAVAGAVVGGAMGAAGGGEEGADKGMLQAQKDLVQEDVRAKEIKRNLVDPSHQLTEGANTGVNVLASMGPLSRIPAVGNALLKAAGQPEMTQGEKMMNLVRPPIPVYNAAKAEKLQNQALTMELAKGRLLAIGTGWTALNALKALG